MNKLLIVTLSATGAFAAVNNAFLFERDVYQLSCSSQGMKDCGSGCIGTDWTCCPSNDRGCPATSDCSLGTNGEYGCCPKGATCGGAGGAITDSYTNTINVPGGAATSTVYSESTTTEGYQPPAGSNSAPVGSSSAAAGSTSVPVATSVATSVAESSYVPVESSTAPAAGASTSVPQQPPYSETETLQTATKTYVQPNTTPVPVVPTPGYGNNSTKPVQTATSAPTTVITNGAGSYGVSMIGGLIAGLAALLI